MDDRIEEIRDRAAHRRLFYDTLNATLRQATDDITYLLDRLDESRRKEGAAVAAIRDTCENCGFNNRPCEEADCRFYELKGGNDGE